MAEHKYTNKLIQEKSPYLLQHAHNPVDWYPWGPEAFSRAVSEDKPIFLSIGYSTCHWCHVMERESFEDEEVAAVLNKHFVPIKVDREERPDIDHIYMSVCQALTGHGGWPLTLFLAPDAKPFYAGTYFPKHDRMGYPGLISILESIADAWNKNKDELLQSADRIIEAVNSFSAETKTELSYKAVERSFSYFKQAFDSTYGGFGSAPKFPSPHNLMFLLRYWYLEKDPAALKMVEKTLDAMRKGGIYDHIGFGFSRYSTDRKWLVPHFEKMLYDNALLAIAYTEAFQATGKKEYAGTAGQILTYVLRDMTSPEGAFYSAEDADSEGVEGKFYVWTPDEVISVLGAENGSRFCSLYDISSRGNFEDNSIPNLLKSRADESDAEFIESCREKLFEHREKRVHPYKDDKILTSWNGLMIAAMAFAGRALGISLYTDAARKAADFIFKKLVKEDGKLLARYRDGESAINGYADDYAFFIWGLIELYEATFEPQYLQKALQLNGHLLRNYWDNEHGGLFIYGNGGEELITRPKEVYDGAMPSGNSVSAMNFLRLSRLTGRYELEEKAQQLFEAFASSVYSAPAGHTFLLSSLILYLKGSREIVLVGKDSKDFEKMLKTINSKFMPFTLTLLYSDQHSALSGIAPYVEGYKTESGRTTAYVCQNFTCRAPVTDSAILEEILDEAAASDTQILPGKN